MTIRILLSCLAICASATLMAQTTASSYTKPFSDNSGQNVAAKTTAASASRCIAIVHSQYSSTGIVPIDSEFCSYSGSRGGTIMNQMKFDNAEIEDLSSGTYLPQYRYTQTFDTQNNLLERVIQEYNGTAWVNNGRTSYTYDSLNNPLTEISESWNLASLSWTNQEKYVSTYTAANKVDTKTLYVWNGLSWVDQSIVVNTYDVMNNLVLSINSNWNSALTTYEPSSKDTIVYDASNNRIYTIHQIYVRLSSSWVNNFKYNYGNYIAPGCFQYCIGQSWDTTGVFVNNFKDTMLYNSYNQPTYYYGRTWTSSGTWVNDGTSMPTHFYYELYTEGLSNINSESNSLELYPNPTSDIVNINFNTIDPAHTNLSVLDMTGRTLAYIDEKSIKSGANSIQWSAVQLPAGVYLVHLNNGNGQEVKRFTVCK